eukprot:scaffold114817_cov32-Tisochrysis_lutea.AAC.1
MRVKIVDEPRGCTAKFATIPSLQNPGFYQDRNTVTQKNKYGAHERGQPFVINNLKFTWHLFAQEAASCSRCDAQGPTLEGCPYALKPKPGALGGKAALRSLRAKCPCVPPRSGVQILVDTHLAKTG